MNLSLKTIAEWLNVSQTFNEEYCQSITIDSRKTPPGSLFIAILGEQYDGHDFIEEARQNGAMAAIVSKPIQTSLPTILVEDTRKALGLIAKKWREQWSLPVIAVTGSCGKTTTKTMIASILSQLGNVLATQGTLNNELGLPLTVLQLTAEHQFAVFELGANHMGEIDYLADIAQPDVSIITNVAAAHLEGFGSLENVAKAKGEIYQRLNKNGVAILNSDMVDYVDFWKNLINNRQIITFSQKQEADFTAHDINLTDEGNLQFVLTGPSQTISEAKISQSVPIHLPLIGKHHVENVLASAAACYALGANLENIQQGLQTLSPIGKRLVSYEGINGAKIIDDSYNANPLSLYSALEVLSHYPQQKILILGDMNELGVMAEKSHQEAGLQAKALGVHSLYTVGKLSYFAVQSFGEGAHHFEDKISLLESLKNILTDQSIILVKGSRNTKMEDIVEGLKKVSGSS